MTHSHGRSAKLSSAAVILTLLLVTACGARLATQPLSSTDPGSDPSPSPVSPDLGECSMQGLVLEDVDLHHQYDGSNFDIWDSRCPN